MRYAILLAPLLALLAACARGGGEAQPTPMPSPAVARPSPTPEPTPSPTPTPGVQRLAYIGTDLDVWTINADGSGQQKLFDMPTEPGESRFFQWSPDGSTFAIASKGVVYIVSVEGQPILEVPAFAFLAWAPSGDVFAVARQAVGPLAVLDLKGELIVQLPSHGFAASTFSADGRRYAYLDPVEEGGICGKLLGMVADLQTGEVKPIDPNEEPAECGIGTPRFSPTDPSVLVYGDRIFDLNTGQEHPLLEVAVSWSPDGQRLLLGCQRAHIYDVATASSILEFDVGVLSISAPCWDLLGGQSAWSPDSRFLATSDSPRDPNKPSVLHVRDLAAGTDKTIPIPENVSRLGAFFPRFSLDGQRLLFSSSLTLSREKPHHTWFVIDSDGSNLTQLAEGLDAAWQPQP